MNEQFPQKENASPEKEGNHFAIRSAGDGSGEVGRSGKQRNKKAFHAKWTELKLHLSSNCVSSFIVCACVHEKGQKIHLKHT